MTSLVKFIFTIGILAGLVYGGIVALALFVQPEQREIVIQIPPEKLGK